jgi:hypothetical protein
LSFLLIITFLRSFSDHVQYKAAILVFIIGIGGFIPLFVTLSDWAYEDPHWIAINPTGFSLREVSIADGETMRFVNPTTGIPQRLCLASDFECVTISDGPKQLQAPGAVIVPGQVLHVTFPTPGNYQVIASTTTIVLTIHVNHPDTDKSGASHFAP